MRKIIFSDVDGTLINREQKELHEGNFEAIKKWREAGNLFVLCTGRNPIDILPTLKMCDIEFDYLVLCNGASLYDQQLNCVYEKQFPLELGKHILHECAKNKEMITFYCDQKELVMQQNGGVVVCDNQGQTHKITSGKTFDQYVDEADCFRMLCLIQEEGNELLYHYQDLLLVPHQEEISWFFNNECIDIMASGVSKGNGMMDLVHLLKVDEENVYAIGDSFNDVSMIEMAAHGCTFAHCPEVLTKRAKHIVPSVRGLIESVLSEKF